MEQNFENEPVGAIIVTDKNILKIKRAKESESPNYAVVIGNFGIEILARNKDTYLINLSGKLVVDTLSFSISIQSLRKWIRPYVFHGTSDDVEKVMEAVLSGISEIPENSLIHLTNFVGKYEDDRITFWVFNKQIMITHRQTKRLDKPEIREIPKSGILKIEDFYIYINNTDVNPTLIPTHHSAVDYDLKTFLNTWTNQLKNPHILYALLGWIIAGMNLEKVNELRNSRFFPFFVLTAQTETGKTALLANCIKILGVNYVGENFSESVSAFVEMKEFSQVSHLPIWRDEYKNSGHALKKEGWLRSVYTRAASSRGQSDQSIVHYHTNATLLLSGEDITDDPALARRMIKVRLNAEDRITQAEYLKISLEAAKNFPKVLPLLIEEPFKSEIFTVVYDSQSIPDDTLQKDELMCYAALGAIFGIDVAQAAVECAKKSYEQKKNMMNIKQTTSADFFERVESFFIEKNYFESPFGMKPKALEFFHVAEAPAPAHKIFCRMAPLFPMMRNWRRGDEYQWSKKSILQMLRENYKAKDDVRRMNGISSTVMVIEDAHLIEDSFGDFLQRIEKVDADWKSTHPSEDDSDITWKPLSTPTSTHYIPTEEPQETEANEQFDYNEKDLD